MELENREELNMVWKELAFDCIRNGKVKFERKFPYWNQYNYDSYRHFEYVGSYDMDSEAVVIRIAFSINRICSDKRNTGNLTISRPCSKHYWVSIKLNEEDVDNLISLFGVNEEDIRRMYEVDNLRMLADEKLNYNEVVHILEIKKEVEK